MSTSHQSLTGMMHGRVGNRDGEESALTPDTLPPSDDDCVSSEGQIRSRKRRCDDISA